MVAKISVLRHRKPVIRSGFNMLEVSLSTLLVAILLTGSMSTVGALVRGYGVRTQIDQKQMLAYELLSEIQQTEFEDPDEFPEFGSELSESRTSRKDFDDVDDFHLWAESPIQDSKGFTRSEFPGFTRNVTIDFVQISNPEMVSTNPSDLKRITVSVTGPDGDVRTLAALRGRDTAVRSKAHYHTTGFRSIKVHLEVDGADTPLDASANLLNRIATEE